MTTPTLTNEQISDLIALLEHRDVVNMVREQRMIAQRSQQVLKEAEERRSMPVVVTDTHPAPGSIYWKMGEQDLLKCIANLKDESVRTGNVDAVRTAESVLNVRRREAQVAALKRGASAMTPLQH